MNAAEIFVDHVLALSWGRLPESTQHNARIFLHDTVAVGAAGARAAYSDIVGEVACGWGRTDAGCGVLGRPGLRLPAPSAAFLNAFQIHAQEFDCVHEGAVLHPMTAVTAALMADAERHGPVPGRELLTACVAGVDVAVCLGLAATTPIKFFRPATAGIFGAVAALARLRRLSRAAALDAFGYALAFASGTMQAHTEGKPALPMQIANAARNAIVAVDLASGGMPGPQASIDGPYGYLPMMEGAHDLARVLPALGTVFRIDEVSCKPFPSGRATHGAIAAVQALVREHGLTAGNLHRLTYRAPPLIAHLCGRPMAPGLGLAQARLCIPFAAALVLTHGTVTLDDFTPARLADPALLALAARVSVEADANPDPAAFVPALAAAQMTDGRRAEIAVPVQFGAPGWPLTHAQHLAKARACLAFAGMEHVHQALAEAAFSLDTMEDAARMFRLAQDGAA